MSDTFAVIQGRILDRIPANIDKTEGEVTQTTVGPLAVELEQVYGSIDRALDECFPDTASRPYLIRDAATRRGLAPFAATFCIAGAQLTGSFTNGAALIGTRYFSNDIPFMVTRQLTPEEIAALEGDKYNYEVTSEVAGTIGNRNTGTLVPFEYVPGLETATLVKIIIPARDEEDTEKFRTRYIEYLRGDAWGGNKLDYHHKVSEFTGAENNKVVRATDMGGYFDIYILGADFGLPSPEFIAYVQQQIDPSDNPGGGDGIAGIGQKPIIKAPDYTNIDINIGVIQFRAGFSPNWQDHEAAITATCEGYLLEMRESFYDTAQQTVFISQLLLRIGNMEQVLNVENLTLNGAGSNIVLAEHQLPFLGSVTHD